MSSKPQNEQSFSFASSSALNLPVSVRINVLDGYQEPAPYSTLLKRADLRHIGSNTSSHSELYVTAQLWADSKPLTVPVQTPYKVFKSARAWNEWLILPIHYSNVPFSAQLAITVWDLSPTGGDGAVGHSIPFGGTTIPLFDNNSTLLMGRQRCQIHLHKAADGLSSTSTPYVMYQARKKSEEAEGDLIDEESVELERLEALRKKHEMGELEADPWLDSLVFRRINTLERIVSKKTNNASHVGKPELSLSNENGQVLSTDDTTSKGGQYFLSVDFPRFDHPIVFTDHSYPAPPVSTLQNQAGQVGLMTDAQREAELQVRLGPGITNHDPEGGRLVKIYDPEVGFRDNPVENKHRRLVRNQRTGVLDRDLKPNAKIRDELSNIIAYGPTQELKPEEKDLIWKFRHHLTRNKRALTKFCKSVSWTDTNEARQAVQLLPKWTEIDVDDALELLGPTFKNPAVRTYAVDRLRKADDDELLVYLLQLVQALKFEKQSSQAVEDAAQDSSLARFLISRAVKNFQLGNFLHWFLMVECDDQSPGQTAENRILFAKVEYDFMAELVKAPEGQSQRDSLRRQGELVKILEQLSKDVRFSKEDRTRKIERLKKFLADPKNEVASFDSPLPLPLDPRVSIVGCFPEESTVFKSSLLPLLINFKTTTGERYPVIFKTGDDLRQDQLVIQIIMLMDRLLRKENLDLKLTPYRILSTSNFAGAVQFIPSMSLAQIVSKYKGTSTATNTSNATQSNSSILAYLRTNNPDPTQALGVRREAMDTYIKSCAGYLVITYLLGVGDRHLDNLLLSPTGHFFHADFGYILGRDPKPFAPLMKLSKEMIEGMGGAQSVHYQAFRQHCFTAYTTLRKSSNLILNLIGLMVDANVQDIRMEPDKAVQKVKERFHLELRTEEEVIRLFEGLMEDSVGAMFPALIDWTHGFVQRFRT